MSVGTNEKPAGKAVFFWNTLGGFLSAFQSVAMLMVITRVGNVVDAGIFSIAYANANVFLNVGKFGVRNYHASDIKGRFSLATYFYARVFTTVVMVLLGAAYLFYSASQLHYAPTKSLVILLTLIFKATDSIEDVFIGDCQRRGKLDVGAKALSIRFATNILVFSVALVLTQDMVPSLVIATVYSLLYVLLEPFWMKSKRGLTSFGDASVSGVVKLLFECVPLFLATFLLLYIGNAPKYAIDAQLDDASQAYYGYISMPVLVINLLSSFIYNPFLPALTSAWTNGECSRFLRMFARQMVYIAAVTCMCVMGAFFIGAPVLGALYNADLERYVIDLLILLIGGGFMAVVSLFTLGITIMRRQTTLIWGYVAVSLTALVLSNSIVDLFGIRGASLLYLLLMFVLSLWFGAVFVLGARSRILSHRSR
ncbi:lipopolysaccharide biosynthesis protein [Enorma phocaeensis]|uniref:Oligosaccharide flippase family protein n=1 Tax=Enorma phocaeensis TaxID=1871019 RepID=A0A921IVG2_9ACTN|nr:hypothetical protein [Enorma phocaeensis]HJG37645.1 hypothetical protein [Enorma phocaeensis]